MAGAVLTHTLFFRLCASAQIYAALMTLECVGLIALCLLSLVYAGLHSEDEPDAHSVQYTSITALVASCALLYFSLDAVLLENVFQFYASQLLHCLITAYVIWHWLGHGEDLGRMYQRFSLAVMIAVCVFQALYLLLLRPVKESFGYRMYKLLGGNAAIRPLYRTASIFFTLLKLDFALGVLMCLLAVFYLFSQPLQIALNVAAGVATLGWLMLGYALVQRESKRLAPYFFLFALLEPAYLIYKLIAMRVANDGSGDQIGDEPYPVFSWRQLLLTGCVAILVRLACIVYALLAIRNFGMGLREKLWISSGSGGHAGQAQPTLSVAHSPLNNYDQGPIVLVQEEPQPRSALGQYMQPLF